MSNRRLPDKVHVLRGTFRPHRHGEREAPPLLPPVTLEPPPWLPALGQVEWRRVVQVLAPAEILTEGDHALLLIYCGLWMQIQQATEQSLPVDPPLAAQLRLCAAELGLTPSSRARLGATLPRKTNPFADFDPPDRPPNRS